MTKRIPEETEGLRGSQGDAAGGSEAYGARPGGACEVAEQDKRRRLQGAQACEAAKGNKARPVVFAPGSRRFPSNVRGDRLL